MRALSTQPRWKLPERKTHGQQFRLVYTTNEGKFHPWIFLDPRPRMASSLWSCREQRVYAHRPAASCLPNPQEEQPLLVVSPGNAKHALRQIRPNPHNRCSVRAKDAHTSGLLTCSIWLGEHFEGKPQKVQLAANI